jgi:hypothetical protein
MKISFLKKIIGLIIAIVLIVSGATFGISYYLLSRDSDQQLQKEVTRISESVQENVDASKGGVLALAYLIASRPDVATAIRKRDSSSLQKVGREMMEKAGLKVITIADREGKVIARGHSKELGDSVTKQINVKKALAGEPSVGIEEGTVVKFSLRAGYPVKEGNAVVGSVTAGLDLSSDDAFVDAMKKNYGIECTVFHHDVRVSTTLTRDGKRAAGTKMDNPEVVETVLKNGQKRFKTNVILGKEYTTAYWPIVCADGRIGGMFFVGRDREAMKKSYLTLFSSIVVLTLIVGGLMILVGFLFARSITKSMTRVIEGLATGWNQVISASSHVSSASQSLAEGASEQAAGIEETSSSIEEMAAMTRQNADNAGQANALTSETSRVVDDASAAIRDLTRSMTEISAASEETGKIIKTIDEIAFQTNLLALNAAVEAARAGGAGAGFAVVADEVRNLALRAAEAAKNTTSLIEGTVKKVKNGSEIVVRANEAFTKVAQGSKKVKELVEEISAASQEQSQGVEQINTAMTEMDQAIQRNAASAEEAASASEEMNAQAGKMKDFVKELVAVVEGKKKKNSNATPSSIGPEKKGKTKPPGVEQVDHRMQRIL